MIYLTLMYSDIARERVPIDVESFQKEKLKPVTTVEGTGANHSINLLVSYLLKVKVNNDYSESGII